MAYLQEAGLNSNYMTAGQDMCMYMYVCMDGWIMERMYAIFMNVTCYACPITSITTSNTCKMSVVIIKNCPLHPNDLTSCEWLLVLKKIWHVLATPE